MILRRRRRRESFEAMRRRLIRETEAALEHGIRNPHTVPPIPVIEVGKGEFDRNFAHWFWRHALELESEDPSPADRQAN